MNKISAILDLSVIAESIFNNQAKTGVSRVVVELANSLILNPNVDLGFSARRSVIHTFLIQNFKNSKQDIKDLVLRQPQSNTLKKLLKIFDSLPPKSKEQIALRKSPGARILHRMSRLTEGFFVEGLSKTDVYHSLYYSLFDTDRNIRNLNLIQMVYDLIAIQSPEYFTQHHTQLIKRVIRNIDKNNFVTTISKSTKDDLCEYCGIESDRVFVTHLAASASFHPCSDQDLIARTRQQYGIPDGPYALSLCTLEPRKNIDHLIRCFRRLAREQAIPDLNLVLVGTRGWKFGRIMAEIEDSTDLGDRLITTGYVPDDDLAPLYSGAEMFVYPSLYEGFGLPPLEAMQCGVPVITSNTSSLPEVVGDAGRMVDPRDEDALCQAMLDIHRSQQLREALSGKSLAQAARFSWARCAAQTEAAYRAVLDR